MTHVTHFLQWHAEHIVPKVKRVKRWLKWISADTGSLYRFQSVDSSKEALKFYSTTLQISLRKCIQLYNIQSNAFLYTVYIFLLYILDESFYLHCSLLFRIFFFPL